LQKTTGFPSPSCGRGLKPLPRDASPARDGSPDETFYENNTGGYRIAWIAEIK